MVNQNIFLICIVKILEGRQQLILLATFVPYSIADSYINKDGQTSKRVEDTTFMSQFVFYNPLCSKLSQIMPQRARKADPNQLKMVLYPAISL